jgi:ABC-type antimicrobial peptide transport system permease subunit
VCLRGKLDVAAVAEGVRADIQGVDPRLPVFSPHQLASTVSTSLAARRFAMNRVGLFGLAAALLAGIGIYGVIAYMVGERTHEFSIRLALGASRRSIVAGVFRQALELTGTGMALGLVGAFVASRLLAGLLYGVSASDPWVFAAVAALLVVVALVASCLPARQAVSVDPTTALR